MYVYYCKQGIAPGFTDISIRMHIIVNTHSNDNQYYDIKEYEINEQMYSDWYNVQVDKQDYNK